MQVEFEIAGISVIGRAHLKKGINNQDAFCYSISDQAIVAVVCDGCGTSLHSEIGAKIAARFLVTRIELYLKKFLSEKSVDPLNSVPAAYLLFPYWEIIRQELLMLIKKLGSYIGADFKETILDYFLFTIVGAIITPWNTEVFSIGDGMIIINGEVINLGPFPENSPPCIAYGLFKSSFTEEDLKFHVNRFMPTRDVRSVLVGTDGVRSLSDFSLGQVLNASRLIGPVERFWLDDRYFTEPELIKTRLELLGYDYDDAAFVAIRRKSPVSA